MEQILKINNLNKNYGKFQAVKNLSFDVPKGQIVGLLGPNGSGKTTIIKTIMGLMSDYNGEVSIAGEQPGYIANKYISYLPDAGHIPGGSLLPKPYSFLWTSMKILMQGVPKIC